MATTTRESESEKPAAPGPENLFSRKIQLNDALRTATAKAPLPSQHVVISALSAHTGKKAGRATKFF